MTTHTEKRFPVSHVVGFVFSLILTFGAAWIALETTFSVKVIMWIIGALAVVQAGLQLIMFMHMTEGEDRKVNYINIGYGAFMAAVIVVGSIWVLTSGHAAH